MSDAPVATTGLSPDGEAAWLRLKLHLEWLDGFDLIFLFSAHAAVVRVLRERLAAAYRARVTGLEVPTPQTPDELMERILPWLLKPPRYQQALNAPVWLDLTRAPAGTAAPDWQRARLDFLARLNERREPLRRALARPLILVLPLAEKAQIKALVPDLWAIRRFSLDLGHWLAQGGAERSPAHPPEKPIPFALSDTEQSQVEEWRRLRGKQTDDRGALVAAARAYDALWRRAQVDTAAEVALWMAESARRILERVGETPEALRDLSVSLSKVGDTDRALGAFEQARAVFTEGLEIAERLAAAMPDHADYRHLPELFRRRPAELDNAAEAP
ncbi:MAG: hypothetical protein GVY09_08405 [Gammaproteobacteria bacterium]|nr:hypothetical protein [Gammaproteobacteria bacterium]